MNSRSSLDDSGYIMAVLLIGMAVTAVLMTSALPAWRQQAQRERELELIFRGEQYARAIALYYKKNAALPSDLDILVTGHYLRKKWKDPVTGDDFALMMSGGAAGGGIPTAPNVPSQPLRGGGPTAPAAPGSTAPGQATPNRGTGPGGPTGGLPQPGGGQQALTGIAGVASKSTATSIIIYSQLQQHNLWPFTYQTGCQKLIGNCPQGGNNPNNRQGGQPGRGGTPGATGPGRGGDGATPLGVPGGAGRTPPPAAGRGGDLGVPVTGRGRGM